MRRDDKEAKGHGSRQIIEGLLTPGTRVAILDDTCTTGGNLLHAIQAAEAAGCLVVKVLAILDRHQGGSAELKRRGYDFAALLEATHEEKVRVVRE